MQREALVQQRASMDWLEDLPGFDDAHAELHRLGREVRVRFGCRLVFEDGTYYQRCPVRLAHTRIGLSPKLLVEESRCTVCDQDPEDCSHIIGKTYDGIECARRITKCQILHIAFVNRPSNPEARIRSVSVSVEELRESLGPDFPLGAPVTCDACLGPCRGLMEADLDALREAPNGEGPGSSMTTEIADLEGGGILEQ